MEDETFESTERTFNWKVLAGVILFIVFVSLGCAFIEPFKNVVLRILAEIFVFMARLAYPRM